MKALNKQERNSAILKFALLLLLCVVIICVPIIITTFTSKEQQTIENEQKDSLVKATNFEKGYVATKVQEIVDLMDQRDTQDIDPDYFNAQLVNILSDITQHSEGDTSWRGVMYTNIVTISKYLIEANKILASSGNDKDQQTKDLGIIVIEFEKLQGDLKDLYNERRKKDITSGLNDVANQLNIEIKKLKNFKSSL
jgi:hypothetical protein